MHIVYTYIDMYENTYTHKVKVNKSKKKEGSMESVLLTKCGAYRKIQLGLGLGLQHSVSLQLFPKSNLAHCVTTEVVSSFT